MIEPNPITYRMLFEDAAGMGLSDVFFIISGLDPDATVVCNCDWDGGHQEGCDIVSAHNLRRRMAKGSGRGLGSPGAATISGTTK